ncbi:hypothetical protein [Methanosarcina acetivorans]|uniref:hypothetical protein n=1 Tax=Methanosarcina acetivorans TaxID=2214 RepID=UPI0012FEE862|nr:hypothetical protein [Methanosarcina acetivorans]
MKMKKIIGIFLAVCFVLSVTAAAASAGGSGYKGYDKKGDNYKKYDYKDGKKHKEYKKSWVKGHSEKRKVGYYQKKWTGYKYIQVIYYKIIMVWIPGFWSWGWFW